jgi:Cof subfamily protein (haloacid dehalogenase superfamily)
MDEPSIPHVLSIKLLALDMDDTLLDQNLTISKENQRALTAAEELGVKLVLASGRAPEALTPFASILGMDRRPGYLIAYNGSQILASDTGAVEWETKLGPALLAETWDLAEALRQPIQTYSPQGILASVDNPGSRHDSQMTGMAWKVVDRAEFMSEPRVKVLLPNDPEALDPVEARFKEVFQGRANMYRSKPYFFEVMPREADKGFALERVATLHGFRQEEVMAIGDSWNDEGMLRWAGVGVAMANGAEVIRRLADWVTTRGHDEGGVAEAVERFILKTRAGNG